MQTIERGQSSPAKHTHEQAPTNQSPARVQKLGKKLVASFMALYSGLFIGSDARLPDNLLLEHPNSRPFVDSELKIMTANVHGWKGGNGSNFSEFTEALEQTNPDIVCMQEVLADGDELMGLHDMGYNVYFDTTKRDISLGRFGNAVMSRSRVNIIDTVRLQNPRTASPRNAIFFEIETVEKTLPIANTHLSIDGQESSMQAQKLYSEIGHQVAVMCGDFNQSPETISSGPFGRMALSPTTATHTFPAHSPRIEIDHIISECGDTASPTELADIGSDHLARIETIDISNC